MKSKSQPIGIDLFCGAGGMSLGFDQAGFDVVAGVDVDPLNVYTYSKNFPRGKSVQADISNLSGRRLRDVIGLGNRNIDVLFGGPPCGGFSLIGKRKLDDPRNTLLYSFARMVRELNPNYFVVENVRGLTIGKSRTILESFIRRIKLAGYEIVSPIQILNARYFGIPQNRERVIIMGYRRGLAVPSYPKPTQNEKLSTHISVWDAIGDLPNIENLRYLFDSDVYKGKLRKTSSHYAKLLRSEIVDFEDNSLPRKKPSIGITGFKRTLHTDETVIRFAATEPGKIEEVSRFYKLSKDSVAKTLRAGSDRFHGGYTAPRPIHPVYPRCITIREGARLHSFPDWFQFHSTIWHGFRQIGNSVPPILARNVAKSIIEVL